MTYTGSEAICTEKLGTSRSDFAEMTRRCDRKNTHRSRYDRRMDRINDRFYQWGGRAFGFVQAAHKGMETRYWRYVQNILLRTESGE